MSWEDFKTLTREEFFLSNEMQKLEIELWNHVMVEAGHDAYTDMFHELAMLVPHLVTPEGKRIKRVPDFSTIIAYQLHTIVAQVGGQGGGQRNGRNQNSDAVNDNIWGDVGNVLENDDRKGCTYKEFLACNPKEYDGKGGAIVYTRWIEKMEPVQDMSGCRGSQKVKYTAGSFVGKALTWWNSQIHTRGREAAVGHFAKDCRDVPRNVNPVNARNLTARACYECGSTDHEWIHKKEPKKRGNRGEPSRYRNVRDYNKKTRTGNAFATTVNPVRREYTGTTTKCTTCNYHHLPETPCRAYFNCNCPGHFAKDCRDSPSTTINVHHVNQQHGHMREDCPKCQHRFRKGQDQKNNIRECKDMDDPRGDKGEKNPRKNT
nr:reverse transcriptase domain-containing protein [Tanacetum cinerariifolium]